MTWVRITCEQEAIVQVDLPVGAPLDALREAALQRLDESGGAEWETIGGEVHATVDQPLPYVDRLDAEHAAIVMQRRAADRLVWGERGRP